ncbi:MAG TPA: tetratricopeptide repeat protein [Candidatus Binataceae bacterium]|nr:tetratricopeptide repeat protein [Candidatus Binataceae bacterium]
MATTTRRKLSRKELKQPDEFISFLDQTVDFVQHNVTRIILGAAGLVAIVALGFAFQFYSQHQERLAAADFYDAVGAVDRKDYKAAEQGFTQLADSRPHRTLGRLSRFYLASVYLDQGQPAKARDALTAYLDGDGPAPFTQLALCQLGVANEDLGDFRKAREAYVRAAAIEGPERGRAELGSARMLAKLGDQKGAIAAYQAFLKRDPFGVERPDVVEALASLGAKPEISPLTSKAVDVPPPAKPTGEKATVSGTVATPSAANPH